MEIGEIFVNFYLKWLRGEIHSLLAAQLSG